MTAYWPTALIPSRIVIPPEAGCGCKLDACTLGEMLFAAGIASVPNLIPDDAAIVPTAGPSLFTVDGGTPIFGDPYLAGRAGFIHAASDIFARGGEARAAAVYVSAPDTDHIPQLAKFLRGISGEAKKHGCSVVNGHTSIIDGSYLQYSISILGTCPAVASEKRGARPDDAILVSKPLAGAIALRGQALLSKDEESELITVLLTSNSAAGRLANKWCSSSVGDVTGFGLVGALAEQLLGFGAEISVSSIPRHSRLKGLAATLGESAASIKNAKYAGTTHRCSFCDPSARALVCDPVTSGPILATARGAAEAALVASGFTKIGTVTNTSTLEFN